MEGRRGFYSLLIIMITVLTVTVIIGRSNMEANLGLDYISEYYEYMDNDDREYLGYLFDDYNKNVNINYVDRLCETPADDDSMSILSPSVLNDRNHEDSARLERSEGIIAQSALKEENKDKVKSSDFTESMETDDKVAILNMMKKLDDGEILKLRKLFNRKTDKDEADEIKTLLAKKLLPEEYNKLDSIINKYSK